MPLAGYVKQNIKKVDKTIRYMSSYCDMRIGDAVFGDQIVYSDSAFFELFTYELRHGSFNNFFFDKGKVFISDEVAKKYFVNFNYGGDFNLCGWL
jgi:putative ABC transport system permease protein